MRDTRYIVAEQAQRIIQGGDVNNDVQVSISELEIFVDQAFGKFIKMSYFENRSDGEHAINGSFIYSYKTNVKCDKDRDKHYAVIPSSYVNLPNGMGIYSVSPLKDEFNTYIPLPTAFASLTRGTAVQSLENNKGYIVENTRIYLFGVNNEEVPAHLLIKLVGGIQSSSSEDNVDMPLDIQSDLVKMTVELYMTMRQVPKDVINDNIK